MASNVLEREPAFVLIETPGASITHVYLGGVGAPPSVGFGGIGPDRVIDTLSIAGLFPEANHLFVQYAPEHDEAILFEQLCARLHGACIFHALSMGAEAFEHFATYCYGLDLEFEIAEVWFINPVASRDGLKTAQLQLVKACRFVVNRLPAAVRRSRVLQQLWHGWDGDWRFHGLWRIIWPESAADRVRAAQDNRIGAYDLVRAAMRDCSVQMILTTSATLIDPAFTGPESYPGFRVNLIIRDPDPILESRVNEIAILGRYPQARVRHVEGSAEDAGGHDSLLVFTDVYRAAYNILR